MPAGPCRRSYPRALGEAPIPDATLRHRTVTTESSCVAWPAPPPQATQTAVGVKRPLPAWLGHPRWREGDLHRRRQPPRDLRLADWEVVDREVEKPVPGAVLRSVALVIDGRCEPLGAGVFEGGATAGVVIGDAPPEEGSRSPQYVVTGMVEQTDDVWLNYGQGLTHGGAQLLLQVQGRRLYARVDGRAEEFNLLSRFPVRVLATSYEWDAFSLTDIRSAWFVLEVAHLPPRLSRARDASRQARVGRNTLAAWRSFGPARPRGADD